MSRYAGIICDDYAAGPGVNVSFFTQGCPHKCVGCHNPETWDPQGGAVFDEAVLQHLDYLLTKNNILRGLSIMGGEPLAPYNVDLTLSVVNYVKSLHPTIKIYLWTGYVFDDLKTREDFDKIKQIISQVEWVMDGPYDKTLTEEKKPFRGSSNQRMLTFDKNFDIIEVN